MAISLVGGVSIFDSKQSEATVVGLDPIPVFAIPGDGQYRLQPTYVEDLAGLMIASAVGSPA